MFSGGIVKFGKPRRGKGERKGDERSPTKGTESAERKTGTLEEPRAPIQTGRAEKQIFCCDARIYNAL